MPKQEIKTSQAPTPLGPYSQGIRSGNLVFVAGQVGIDPRREKPSAAASSKQGVQTLENVKAVLAEGGATLDDVVKVTVHVADIATFAEFNGVYETYFAEPRPVRTTVESGIPGGFLVEIDVIADTG